MSQSKYFDVLKNLPRVGLTNIKENPYSKKRSNYRACVVKKKMCWSKHTNIKPRIGYSHGVPFQKLIPKYGFNRQTHLKRQYMPLTLWDLQNLIDLGRIDPSEPIDINTVINTRRVTIPDSELYYGLYLVEQGANIFEAKVNIEVQVADEMTIAAIEKCGGTITTAFYDRQSFLALCDPIKYFLMGKPIQKRMLPPQDLLKYYSDPKTRGYLSDPVSIQEERIKLSEQYGYVLPDITKDEEFELLTMKKDPLQIFYGLAPGWIVNLADETIIKPDEKYIDDYYKK